MRENFERGSYQVERVARFQPDSTLAFVPTDAAGIGDVVQFVVDNSGRVIPESLYPLTALSSVDSAGIRNSLARWRYQPAMVGDQPTCQVLIVYLRRADKRH